MAYFVDTEKLYFLPEPSEDFEQFKERRKVSSHAHREQASVASGNQELSKSHTLHPLNGTENNADVIPLSRLSDLQMENHGVLRARTELVPWVQQVVTTVGGRSEPT